MDFNKRSKASQNIVGALMSICLVVVAAQVLKADLTSIIFGVANQPTLPSEQIAPKPLKSTERSVQQIPSQTELSGYEHYRDKDGNEVIIVPARYESKAEPAPIQAAPQQSLQQVAPLASQVSPARVAPVQAAPPRNLTLVAMRAANAHTGMNVFESCRDAR